MPEGHTVHRLARTFSELFAGEAVSVSSPQGRFAPGAALINGQTIVEAQAFGKQMFLGFSSVPLKAGEGAKPDSCDPQQLQWLRVHLGLYGSWTFAGDSSVRVAHAIGAPRKRIGEQEKVLPSNSAGVSEGEAEPNEEWEAPSPRGQVRVRIVGPHAVADLTGPTACEVLTWDQALVHIRKLGPDPIRPDADYTKFISKVSTKRVAIGQLLMDQSVIAGVGNIYRAEALFRAQVDPFTPGNQVDRSTLTSIWNDLVVLMADGVRTGAIVTTEVEDRARGDELLPLSRPAGITRQNTDGEPDAISREDSFYVYHRQGQPCRVCATAISLTDMAARKLYWCPSCQK